MQYQLVLQLPENLISFDQLVKIENDITKIIKDDEVDGHDIGSGEINFFILTNNPDTAFNSLRQYLTTKRLWKHLKAAYRDINGKDYIILYPNTLKEFKVI
jgi:hypothetical protein